jgi:hypothetical protein
MVAPRARAHATGRKNRPWRAYPQRRLRLLEKS